MLQNEVSDATDHTSILNVCQNLHVVSQYEDVPALMYSMDLTQVSSCALTDRIQDWMQHGGIVQALMHSINLRQVSATLARPPRACVAHRTPAAPQCLAPDGSYAGADWVTAAVARRSSRLRKMRCKLF